DGSGNLTWYQDLSEALGNAGEGSTIILYQDVEGGVTVSAGCGVTLDLNGHEIKGGVTAEAKNGSATTLTICDTLGGGSVTGTVSGGADGDGSTVKIQGGTYYGDVPALADSENGCYAVYRGLAEDGVTPIYDVCPESDITGYASFYVGTEEGVRTYYTSFEDAVAAAGETGTVVLACDAVIGTADDPYELSAGNLKVDLNGFSLEAYMTVEAGSAESGDFVPGATLEITDSSEGAGSLSGVITVKGDSNDTEATGGQDQSNSFDGTLTVVSSAVTDGLTVDTTELSPSASGHLEYTFSLVTAADGSTHYGLVAGHEHAFDIAEAFMDSDGVIKVRIRCSCGAYYTSSTEAEGNAAADESQADVFCVSGNYTAVENDDGTISYVLAEGSDVTLTDKNGEAVSAGEGSNLTVTYSPSDLTLTMTPSVKIEWTENGEKVTYYLDEETVEALGSIINGANPDSGTGVTVTLLGDTYVESLEISGKDVTIDLNGHELSGGSITLSSSSEGEQGSGTAMSASLEITDSSASSDEGAESVGEGKVSGVEITLDSESSLVLSGGTYDGDVSVTSEDGSLSDIKDCVKTSTCDEDATYCMVDNGDGTFTVTTTDIAEKDAAVKVVIGESGNTREIYFGSIKAALDYIESHAVSDAEIVLIKDCGSENVLEISSSVTIDLAGNTLTADITVENAGSLTVKDSSAEDEGDGTGLLDGNISGDGDISVESGSFTENVGQYVASGDGKVLLATADDDGNMIYTVTCESSVAGLVDEGGIQAKITYTAGNGDEAETEVIVYYESVEDAATALKDGDTLTILTDIENPVEITVADGMKITIDLGGNTLTADIKVEDGGSLIVKDSSAESGSEGNGLLEGSISGDGDISIESGSFTEDVGRYVAGAGRVLLATADEEGKIIYTVTDESSVKASVEGDSGDVQAKITYTVENGDGEVATVTVYYESVEDAIASLKDGDTLTLLADVEAEEGESPVLTFEYADEDGNVIGVTLDLNGHGVSGGISVGDGVNLTITDSGDEGGHVSGEVESAEGGNLTIEGGIYDYDITEYVSDGSYVYAASTEEGYSFEVTGSCPAESEEMSVAATVTFTDENGERVTVYFEDLQGAVNYASDISSGDGARGDVVVTLADDYESTNAEGKDTISVSGGNFTIDLGDNTLDADVEIEGGASVEITGDTGSEVTGDVTADGASLEISGDTVYSGSMSEANDGKIEVSGGTFSSDVSKWTTEGYDAVYSSGDGTYSVKDGDTVKDEAVASVTVTTTVDGEKAETTTYYDSFEEALKALYEAMEGAEGDTEFTLTLWDDVDTAEMSEDSELFDADGALIFEGTFTFDLNGNSFTGDVAVADGAEVDMDLSGGTYTGNVVVGEDEAAVGATFNVTDSSAEYDEEGSMTKAGTGLFDGTITDNNNDGNSITVDGGTFTSDVGDYVGDEYETVIGKDGETYVIVPKTDVDDFSEAYVTVTTGSETVVTYYESVEDAINAAALSGGTVTLTGDAAVENLIISSSVTIDLNGYDLTVGIVIDADAGGELTITDSEGTGELSGTITVVGSQSCSADENGNAVNPYGDVLVMNGGAAPGADLTI
ncbi:MAG: hypothetical protein LUC16_02750, partial [Coprobacillus sp.]|nr:hypothetical protein [Coprobacillus sp.]